MSDKNVFNFIKVGDNIPELTAPPSDRTLYVKMAEILQDPNPLHLDPDYARERGMKDVVQQGPFNAALVYRHITDWLPHPWCLRRLKLRFTGNVFPGDVLVCRGTVTKREITESGVQIGFDVREENQNGEVVIKGQGEAIING